MPWWNRSTATTATPRSWLPSPIPTSHGRDSCRMLWYSHNVSTSARRLSRIVVSIKVCSLSSGSQVRPRSESTGGGGSSRPRRYRSALASGAPGSLRVMDDADIVRDELDRYFASNLAATTAAVSNAQQSLDDWQRSGTSSRADVIAAWKYAAARALAVAQGHWSPDEDLPAEVEVALRTAIRAARR